MGKKFSGRYCTAEDDPMSESVRFHLENLPCNSDISNLDGGGSGEIHICTAYLPFITIF